jgi:hypothetical protein
MEIEVTEIDVTLARRWQKCPAAPATGFTMAHNLFAPEI